MTRAFNKIKTERFEPDDTHYHSVPQGSRNPNDSNLFIPKTREIVEAIQPRMTSDFLNISQPFVEVIPREKGDAKKAEATKQWLFYFATSTDFSLRLLPFLKQALIYGNTVGRVAPRHNRLKGRGSLLPVFRGDDIYRYRIDPDVAEFEDRFDEAFVEKARKADLELQAKNKFIPFINLEEVMVGLSGNAKERATDPDPPSPSDIAGANDINYVTWYGPLDVKSGKFSKYAQKLCRVCLANEVLVLFQPDPYGNNESPVIFHRFEFDPNNIYGIGIPRMLHGLQKELNEIHNLKINFMHRLMAPMIFGSKSILVNQDQTLAWGPWKFVETLPGVDLQRELRFVYPGDAGGISAATFDEQRITREMQQRSSVDEYLRGTSGEFPVQQTATEFEGKLQQATLYFISNFKLLCESAVKKIMLLHLEQIIALVKAGKIKREQVIRILGPENSYEFLKIDLGELISDVDLIINIDPQQTFTALRRQQIATALEPFVLIDRSLREFGKAMNWPQIGDKAGKLFLEEGLHPWVIDAPQPPPIEAEATPPAGVAEEVPPPLPEEQAGEAPPLPEELLAIPEPA